jgi:hypothetical protein
VRQAELERGSWHASVLTGEFDARPAPRYLVRFGFEFPALRGDGGIDYGLGDMRIRATARLYGDTLDGSGVFLRGDVRIPTGARKLRPFCNASLDGGAGIEVRLARGGFAARGAVLYTLAGERLWETDFKNDNALTTAVSIGVPIPRIASVTVSACLVRFDGGASREILLCSLTRHLSDPLVLGVEAGAETGTEGERIYDSLLSVSLSYRFPSQARPPSRKSDEQ